MGTGVAGFLHLVLTIILSGCTITLGIKFKNNEKQLKDIYREAETAEGHREAEKERTAGHRDADTIG